jgi:hypothetical protein
MKVNPSFRDQPGQFFAEADEATGMLRSWWYATNQLLWRGSRLPTEWSIEQATIGEHSN